MRLLFVCTGNLCRSPLAEGLTTAWVKQVGATDVEIASAGTAAPDGEPMDRHSAAALTALGGDPAGLLSTPLTEALATSADLVLTMTRQQRKLVLERAPRGLRRTFTLLEAADLLSHTDVRDLRPLPLDERVREFGLRLDAGRARRTASETDDVLDPIGRRASVHDEVAQTIAAALRPLLNELFPARARRVSGQAGILATR